MALVGPVLVVLLAGVGDLGRAFYFKIAVTNAAREAAHWATLLDSSNTAPTDSEIIGDIGSPSQESFGLCLESHTAKCPGNGGLAPASVVHTQPGTVGFNPTALANPGGGNNLSPGQSYLYIYPDKGPCGTCRTTSLARGMHWQEVSESSRIVTARTPSQGGLNDVLRQVAGSLYPREADAAATCYTWTDVSIAPTSFTTSNAPTYNAGPFSIDLVNVSGSGNGANTATLTVNQLGGVPSFQSTFSSTNSSTGSIDPQHPHTDVLNMSHTLPASPGTYTYQLQVTSTGGSCSQAVITRNFTITIPPGPSPSPIPSPSPSPIPSATPPVSPPPSPIGGGTPPVGSQITCTVIYYYQPITPLVFLAGSAVYIVGTATLQATY